MRPTARGLTIAALLLALGGCTSAPAGPRPTSPTIPPVAASPASSAASPAATPTARPGTPAASASPSAGRAKPTYAFPVVGRNSYARTHHDYPASDVITACGNTFRAVTSGTVLAVTRKDRWNARDNAGATRGGLSVSLLGDDGVRYYGSHLSVIRDEVTVGARVTTGQTLGKVGDSGDASACHLHFGISPPCARTGDWWNQRGTVWPWRYLDSWRKGGARSAAAEVTRWRAAHGCPTKPQAFP